MAIIVNSHVSLSFYVCAHLIGLAQHIDEFARQRLVVRSEEGVRDAGLARAARAPDAVHIVFRGQRERVVDHVPERENMQRHAYKYTDTYIQTHVRKGTGMSESNQRKSLHGKTREKWP